MATTLDGADSSTGAGPVNTPGQGSGAAPSTLAGSDSQSSPETNATASGDQADPGNRQVILQIRQMQQATEALAGKFPAAVTSLRKANEALQAAMRQIISNPGGREPEAPRIPG